MLQHENETNTCRWAGNVSSANFCSGFTTASSNFLSAPIEHKQALQYPNSLDLLPKELQNNSKQTDAIRSVIEVQLQYASVWEPMWSHLWHFSTSVIFLAYCTMVPLPDGSVRTLHDLSMRCVVHHMQTWTRFSPIPGPRCTSSWKQKVSSREGQTSSSFDCVNFPLYDLWCFLPATYPFSNLAWRLLPQ